MKKKNVVHKTIDNDHYAICPSEMKVENAQKKPDNDSRQGAYQRKEKKTVYNQYLFPWISAQKAKNTLLNPPETECAE